MGEATELSTLLRDFSAFMRRGGNLNYSMNGLRLEDALLEAANKLALPDESGKLREALRDLDAGHGADAPRVAGVPEGWQLVPKEPTQAMLDAVGPKPQFWDKNAVSKQLREDMDDLRRREYREMLSAAPSPDA